MKQQIQMARMRSGIERTIVSEALPGQAGKGVRAPTRNIFDEYEQMLTGASMSWRETSILGKASDAAADAVDAGLVVPMRHITNVAKLLGARLKKSAGAQSYKRIVEQLGPHSPYKSSEEWVLAQGVKQPLTVRKLSQSLNELATNLVLRWDPFMAHASLNMLGLIPTLMSGVRAGAAPNSLVLKVKGRDVGFIDSLAIIKRGLASMLDPAQEKHWRIMARNGDATQSTLEYNMSLGAVKSQAGWHKWASKMDKWVSFASESSENWSRQVAHFVGLEVAKYQRITGDDEMHLFAREFANAAIADYAPTNRPELYQTAFGSVFGLFQSYSMAQFTKMFHWMEKGDYAAFGTQAAVQASLFGLAGTYGLGSIFSVHDSFFRDSGEPSIMDTIYWRFGPTLGNAIAHGGIAELTGVALWSRGDINPRMPVSGSQLPPGLDVIKRMTAMSIGTVESFLNNTPDAALPAAIEIIQREMPNRVLKGVLGQIQGGQETDRSGNIIHDSQGWLDSISRVAGLRSSRQQLELEAYYAGKSDMQRDSVRREKVRNRLRTDIRAATRRGEKIDPLSYFDDYVASGGNPTTFRSWVRTILRDADDPRSAAQLRTDMNIPRNGLNLWRYGAYGAWPIN